MSGTILKGTTQWITKNGLRGKVTPLVEPAVAQLFDRAPLAIAWFPGHYQDVLLAAVDRVAGTEKCVAFGLEGTRESFGPVLRPVLQGMLNVFGARPQSIFARLNTVCSFIFKGIEWEFVERPNETGHLTMHVCEEGSRGWYAGWAGSYNYVFEIAGSPGQVTSWKVSPGGQRAEFELSFTKAA